MKKLSAAQQEADRRHMARCLELAREFEGRTAPNPIVGCVIVNRAGKVIAEGAHKRAGTAHGEIVALTNAAKKKAKLAGATLYVNLEPCNHTGRTGPCAPVVRDSGVARVVIGMPDPIADHAGGIAVLKKAKIAVTTGVLREECERANLAWTIFATQKRAAFTLKAAITLDGKIATVTGHSKYVTGEKARADVMRLRAAHDAILVGIGTVLADDPALTARIKGGRDPIRVILDGALRTPPSAQVTADGVRRIIACRPDAPADREAALVARGCEVWRMPVTAGRIDLGDLAHQLAKENIVSVLVEGGGEVHASMLEHRLCDLVHLYIAPKVIGGPAPSWVGGSGRRDMGAAVNFVFDDVIAHFGADIRLTGRPVPAGE